MSMLGILAGAKHVSQLSIIRYDHVLLTLFKWVHFPAYNTIGRYFKRFKQENCLEISSAQSKLRQKIWDKKSRTSVTLDIDSSVRSVFGSQEGAGKGFNPKKKGARSYHPLYAFIAETRECLHSWFRCGSAYTSNNCVGFLKECFAQLPTQIKRVLVRADSGFFSGDIISYIESKAEDFLIKVKLLNLSAHMECQDWESGHADPNISTSSFQYACNEWEKTRRFVAIRILVNLETENCLLPIPAYEYFCYVTSLDLTPLEIHALYGQRASSENWIEWCKNHVATGSFLTQKFWANAAMFQTCVLAYNLSTWMRLLVSEKAWHEEPNTFALWFIHAPARLISTGKRWFLRLPMYYFWKLPWKEILFNINQLKFS